MPSMYTAYGKLALIFVIVFCAGNYYGANLYEHYLGSNIETYILYTSAILAIVFGLLYAGGKIKYNKSLSKINGRLYSPHASDYLDNHSVDKEIIEATIQNSTRSVRRDSTKYKWSDQSVGSIIVILNKDNVIIDISC